MKSQSTEDRIAAIRAEIDAFIDEKAAEELKLLGPGVPLQIVRDILTARGGRCQCAQYLEIAAKEKVA
ncbi:hypothetical protein [Tardiphaga sp. 709]|uniref:hypothetical protein n=1 Tax=Tardiphaga sp. 709 TaxID=3076039 RepID=UPI0028EBBAC7|nr:hypothetical protein [Tardiphaga sp. 709]WNV10170.1 hypothetical protein RSO67_02955 [Tardiphaga sp. 709]